LDLNFPLAHKTQNMKRHIYIVTILLSFSQMILAQIPLLWGMTSEGGSNGMGTIFNINGDGSSYSQLFSFPSNTASKPNGNLTLAVNGMLYGVTYYGGANGSGTIYSIDTASGLVSIVYNFLDNGVGGTGPSGSMVAASNGLLYGLCVWGDSSKGCIYSFDPANNIYTTLKYFPTSSDQPSGNLMQASNGKLYGITTYGGMYMRGVLFSYDILTNTFSFLHDFDLINGEYPLGNGLAEDHNGKLWGMTTDGGLEDKGVLFSYDTATSVFSKILDFTGPNGAQPEGSLLMASNGLLYGSTVTGGLYSGGIIFSVDPTTNIFTKLFDLQFAYGAKSYGSMIQSANGLLYGLSYSGGANHHGVIFSFDPVSLVFQDEFDLLNPTGEFPNGSLIEANNKLYGATSNGGSFGNGTVFNYDYSNSTFNSLFNFSPAPSFTDWLHEQGSLTQAFDGKLYGVYQHGGANQNGYLFRYDPVTFDFDICYDFHPTEGYLPMKSVLQCSDGKIYGVVQQGGYWNAGAIFSFEVFTDEFKFAHVFNVDDGMTPMGSLIELADGNLYGTTSNGGPGISDGVLYEFDPVTDSVIVLYEFDLTTGSGVEGDKLIMAPNGKFYGNASDGGANFNGVIFSFDTSSNTYSDIHDYNSNEASFPIGGFVSANNGLMYTIQSSGGPTSTHILSVDPANDVYSTAYDFIWNGSEGSEPRGILYNGSDGNLYGMTSEGGLTSNGVIFKFDPVSSTYTKIHDFDGIAGGYPYGDLIELSLPLIIDESNNFNSELVLSPNPTTGKLTIRNMRSAIKEIQIFNLIGKKVMSVPLQTANCKLPTEIDISNFPSGIYILQVSDGENVSRAKVVKE
jgi:uncharacterized repeat protein (TIGR03803 family)